MIELVTTSGIFALDGGEWEVTNNIWLVGDDREVIVIDAAHDAAPILLHPDDLMLWHVVYPDREPDLELTDRQVLRCARTLTPAEIAAYDAPFPDDTYTAGARIFPSLVPATPDGPGAADNQAAWTVLETFDRPFLCAFSDSDPVTAGGEKPFVERVPGAAGREHVTIAGAAHFLQEDAPQQLADVIVGFIAATGGAS